jgi:hypothetical protein
MTIEQLSSITRINVKFIEALETGRRDRLPGQIYLKPFVKTCSETLGLDLKELYKIIDGESGGKIEQSQVESDKRIGKRRFDYKLWIVLLTAAVVCVVIYLALNAREKVPPRTRIVEIIPAEVTLTKKQAKWSRPWERPAFRRTAANLGQNLVLMAKDSVAILLIAGEDTLFNGIMAGGDRKVFSSHGEFVISIDKNERVTGFLNGWKDATIGENKGKLDNYRLAKEER